MCYLVLNNSTEFSCIGILDINAPMLLKGSGEPFHKGFNAKDHK
jgi:hypothetical protein